MAIASKINFKATTSTNTDNKTEFPPENEWKIDIWMSEWLEVIQVTELQIFL